MREMGVESNMPNDAPNGVGDDDGNNFPMPSSFQADRDGAVMSIIEQEELTGFTFDGLRRRTGTHPETLSRILDRLQDQGVIQTAPDGYRVTDKARRTMVVHALVGASSSVPLLSTLLPYDVEVKEIVSELKGRWFGRLRWVGYSENEEGTILKWVTEEGKVRIDARFSEGDLSVEARMGDGSTLNEAVRAAHELVGHISRMYSGARVRRPQRLQLFRTHLALA